MKNGVYESVFIHAILYSLEDASLQFRGRFATV